MNNRNPNGSTELQMFRHVRDRKHPQSSRSCERNLDFTRLLTFSSARRLLRPAGDNRQPQPFQMNKSCGNAPRRTPGSKKALASIISFLVFFTLSCTFALCLDYQDDLVHVWRLSLSRLLGGSL